MSWQLRKSPREEGKGWKRGLAFSQVALRMVLCGSGMGLGFGARPGQTR